MASKRAEIVWGTAQEERIGQRWMALSEYAEGASCLLKAGEFADVDFVLLDREGMPVCYVEVKYRRKTFAAFGDALFPLRKHTFAKKLYDKHSIPFIGVAEYSCRTIVEVDLLEEPARRWNDFKRHDRSRSVPHIVYSRNQLTVLEEGKAA